MVDKRGAPMEEYGKVLDRVIKLNVPLEIHISKSCKPSLSSFLGKALSRFAKFDKSV